MKIWLIFFFRVVQIFWNIIVNTSINLWHAGRSGIRVPKKGTGGVIKKSIFHKDLVALNKARLWISAPFSQSCMGQGLWLLIPSYWQRLAFLFRTLFPNWVSVLYFGPSGFSWFILSLAMHHQQCLLNPIQNFYMF